MWHREDVTIPVMTCKSSQAWEVDTESEASKFSQGHDEEKKQRKVHGGSINTETSTQRKVRMSHFIKEK